MKSQAPTTRTDLIERSLRSFRCGLVGLIPVLGVPFAARAWLEYFRLRRPREGLWNPASRYLTCSALLASAGLMLTLLLCLWVVVSLAQSTAGGGFFFGGGSD